MDKDFVKIEEHDTTDHNLTNDNIKEMYNENTEGMFSFAEKEIGYQNNGSLKIDKQENIESLSCYKNDFEKEIISEEKNICPDYSPDSIVESDYRKENIDNELSKGHNTNKDDSDGYIYKDDEGREYSESTRSDFTEDEHEGNENTKENIVQSLISAENEEIKLITEIERLRKKEQIYKENNKKEKLKKLRKIIDEKLEQINIEKAPDISMIDSGRDTSIELNKQIDISSSWYYKATKSKHFFINLYMDDSSKSVYDERIEYINNFCSKSTNFFEISYSLNIEYEVWQSLFEHQRYAVKWLWDNLFSQMSGGILGDEMGLGKTVITSVFLNALILNNKIKRPSLIVCPLTVAQHWVKELHIWCPNSKVILLHKSNSNPGCDLQTLLKSVRNTTDVIVTNYEKLNDEKNYGFRRIKWGCIFADEAHRIKNDNVQCSIAIKRLKSKFRLAISGSLIQNNLMELWSIFDFCCPGILGTKNVFEKEIAVPIKIGTSKKAKKDEIYKAYYLSVHLQKKIKKYLIARKKKDINLNLPTKTDKVLFCKLTPKQEYVYTSFLEGKISRNLSEKYDYLSKTERENWLLKFISRLREICNYPFIPNSSDIDYSESTKLNLLFKLLPQFKSNNNRVLIFSHSLEMLDLIGGLLQKLDLDFYRLDGKTSPEKRNEIILNFNSGYCFACLLSIQVGGFGINLVGADRVIIVDPDWNPANDNQATERCYRIGQDKNVCVYRIITKGTIEEKIYQKQVYKTLIAEKVLESADRRTLDTHYSLHDLFRYNSSVDNFVEECDDTTNNNEEDVDNPDYELLKTFLNEGDVQHLFNHGDLFVSEISNSDHIKKIYSKREANHASNFLSFDDQILEFFNNKNGKASRRDVIDFFKSKREFRDHYESFKKILKSKARFNQKNKTWYLYTNFLKNF